MKPAALAIAGLAVALIAADVIYEQIGRHRDRNVRLCSGLFRSPSPRYTKEIDALNDYWFHELQPRLAALSTRGRLVIEEDAEKPKAVIEAVRDVVDQVRTVTRP